jgi:hypothetical protein
MKTFIHLDENNVVINVISLDPQSTDISAGEFFTGEINLNNLKLKLEVLKQYLLDNNISTNETDEEILEWLTKYLQNYISTCPTIWKIIEINSNQQSVVGFTYDQTNNRFIPLKPNETYVLDPETLEWHPDPNLNYKIYNDDHELVDCTYVKNLKGFQLIETKT